MHCHDWMTALAGIRLRKLLGIPLVYNVHLPQSQGPTRLIENLALVTADLVLVNSDSVRQELERHRLPIHCIEVVPNGVDTDLFTPSASWPEDDDILFVGRLVPQKGVDTLLRAFGAVLRRCPDARLIVVGSGDLELYFERMSRHLGIYQRVSIIEWQSGPPLIELFRRCRMLVVPSYYEPFGIVALEAMACARPVIASSTGGLSEIIRHGHDGYLVPAGDHLRLASRIVELLENPELCTAMGREALHHSRLYTWTAIADTTFTLYKQLAQSSCKNEQPRVLYGLKREMMRGVDEGFRPIFREMLAD